jgi:hypothetical protein
LAIAIPPAVVKVPPFVSEIASVVFDIPIPPANVRTPVVELVLAVVPGIVNEPKDTVPATIRSDPTYSFLAIEAPPAVVKVPPLVILVASVVLLIPIPPGNVKAPVILLVLAVVSVNVKLVPEATPNIGVIRVGFV